MTIILFIVVIAVLIFVHELGHFLVARAFGIRVDKFALGFGPAIWSRKVMSSKHGETTYAINILPLGGYVKIFGEDPDEASMSGPDSSRSFVNKSRPKQVAVLIAGIFFNFIFAIGIFSLVFMIGFPVGTDSYPEYADRIRDQKIMVTFVEPNSPAETAGIKAGDFIIADSVADVQSQIFSSAGQPVTLQVKHPDKALAEQDTVNPTLGIVSGKYAIGITMAESGLLQLPVHLAIWEGLRYTSHTISETFVGIYGLLSKTITGQGSLDSVSGPIGIASIVGDAARLGFVYVLFFTALISVNLGVLNLIPFPALDGGRILFVLIESVIRRRIKPSIANITNAIGFALLILLMIVVTWHDIAVKFF